MDAHVTQPLQSVPSPTGTGIVSVGPAGTRTSIEQSGRALLKTYCDEFPNTNNSFIIPPMFESEYTEVMPEHSRGLNRKEKNKYDGATISQSGEMAEKVVYDTIHEILRKEKFQKPFLAFFGVHMDDDNELNIRRNALLSELPTMNFTGIKTSGELDCVIVMKDLGVLHIEIKRTNNPTNLRKAENQLENGVKFVTNLMNAVRGSPVGFPTVKVIALPCEMSQSQTCKTKSGSFVAHSDVCQNFTPMWDEVITDLENRKPSNPFSHDEFMRFCNFLMGWYSSEPLYNGTSAGCTSNDSRLSLPKHVTNIDEKVQRAEITSEEQKLNFEREKENPLSDIIRTNPMDIFRSADGIGLLYLTPTQHYLYHNCPQAIVHGHGGTGKTILCLMKMMELIRRGAIGKICFVAPSPSHLFCSSILLKNNLNAKIFTEFPMAQDVNCDVVIVTLSDFFKDPNIMDNLYLSGYNIFVDDLQDYYNENLCNSSNLRKIGNFLQKSFIAARNEDLIAWFCFDIVQCSNLEVKWDNLIWCFPQFQGNGDIPLIVYLKHVLRNTSEIISTLDEGRRRTVVTYLAPQSTHSKIVKEFYNGHQITSERVQCHRLNSSVDPAYRISFVVKRLEAELKFLTGSKYALPLSDIAILVDDELVLEEYKDAIDQMLLACFKTVSQSIEESIIYQRKDQVLLDVTRNVASFESPCVVYIRTEAIGRIYRMVGRARTKLTILDVNASPLQSDSIDLIEWYPSHTGSFYNYSETMDALKDDNFEKLENLISKCPDRVKLRTSDGLTPFLRAAELGSVKGMKACINLGSNLNEKDDVGKTAAMLAMRAGQLEALKFLMKSYVSAYDADNDGNTILHHAIEGGNVECVKWIIETYPELVRKTLILFELASNGNVEMLKTFRDSKILHDQGMSLEEADNQGNTILHHAYKAKQKECFKWILHNYPNTVYFTNKKNPSILFEIAEDGDVEMLEMLRDQGMSLEEADNQGNTILHRACKTKQKECFKWILQNYPNTVHVTNKKNTSILFEIVEYGDGEMLKVLHDEGISLEETDNQGNTILRHVLRKKKTKCFKWILQNCPHLAHATNSRKTSILHEIAQIHNYEMMKILCIHEKSSKESKNPKYFLHQAAIDCDIEQLKILIGNELKLHVNDEKEIINVHLHSFSDEDVTIFSDNGIVFDSLKSSTVFAPAARVDRKCKVYYEVEVLAFWVERNPRLAIGWATTNFIHIQDQGKVGDCDLSYAFQPGDKSHKQSSVRQNSGNTEWGENIDINVDKFTVGVAADLEKGKLLYSLDGNWKRKMGVAFNGLDKNVVLFPAISGRHYDSTSPLILQVNFGAKEFKYSPPDSTFKSVEELIKGTNILHVLARNNKVECCKYIIDTYPNLLNEVSGRGTPLHECASTGALESMRLLLDAGADMTLKNVFGVTAFDIAMNNDQLKCVLELNKNCDKSAEWHQIIDALKDDNMAQMKKLLSENPKLIKLRILDGHLALLPLAALCGNIRAIKICISYGSNPCEKDFLGQTAAILAVRSGHLEVLKFLMKNGALAADQDNDGNTILHHAYDIGNFECVSWILQNYSELVLISNNRNISILHMLANHGNVEMLEICRDKNINFEKLDSEGNTILHHAYDTGNFECVGWILQNYSELALISNNRNISILHMLANQGNVEMLEICRDRKINLKKLDSEGNTILHHAYNTGNFECVGWILQNNPELVLISNNINISILHMLANQGNVEMLKICPDRKINLEKLESEGNTILHHAYDTGNVECVGWILQNYPELALISNNVNISILHMLANQGNVKMLKICRDRNINMEKLDSEGNTILHHAYKAKQKECFKWILQHYPNTVHLTNKNNTSILFEIAEDGDIEMLEILRDEGISLEEADSEGKTILHHAVRKKNTICFGWILQNCPQLAHVTNDRKNSILHEVAQISERFARYELMKILCTHEKSSKESKKPKFLLHQAAIDSNVEQLKTLIENEMKRDVEDEEEINVHLHSSSDEDVTIFSDNGIVFDSPKSSTVFAPAARVDRSCKVYYEVEVLKCRGIWKPELAIGWATTNFIHMQNQGKVGDCNLSYAFQPGDQSNTQSKVRHNNENTEWGENVNINIDNVIIGVAADLENGKLLYSLDGNWNGKMGVAYDGLDKNVVLFPAISGACGSFAISGCIQIHSAPVIPLHVNFGAKEFKYSPPDSTFKSVEELIKGTNILHVLARNNKVECGKYIIDTYPNLLNEVSGRGTPLHECASTGALESMRLLLDAGADMTLKNVFGATAFDVAKSNDQLECAEILNTRYC